MPPDSPRSQTQAYAKVPNVRVLVQMLQAIKSPGKQVMQHECNVLAVHWWHQAIHMVNTV